MKKRCCHQGSRCGPFLRHPRSTRLPGRDRDFSDIETAFRGEGSENFAMAGRTETARRSATNFDQSLTKKERAIMARTHG
jgi:hypothetical protein